MHQLLSKDVLEQPMREIGARYLAWLDQHVDVIPYTSGALYGEWSFEKDRVLGRSNDALPQL